MQRPELETTDLEKQRSASGAFIRGPNLMEWLVAEHERERFADIYHRLSASSGMTVAKCAEQLGTQVEKIKAFQDDMDTVAIERGALSIVDGAAIIPIKGMLVDKPDFFLTMFGIEHTAYETLVGSVAQAEADEDVDRIVFEVDSPGGLVDGLTQAADVIFSTEKETFAQVTGLCASAAYWLTSQCGTITASNRADRFGSIGTMVTVFVSDSLVSIASRNAPRKAPDVRTEEGVDIVQDQLDDFAAIFVDAIARGRGVSAEDINANFGQGGILLAERALSVNMIDAVEPSPSTQTQENDMQTEANSATGIRAVFGLSKDTSNEDLFAHVVNTKAKAEGFDALKAEHETLVGLHEVSKTQLAAQSERLVALEKSDADRTVAAFETKRDSVIDKAVEDGKAVPAQVDHLKSLAKDEAGLKGLEELFAASKSLGLTTVAEPFTTEPTGDNRKLTAGMKDHKELARQFQITPVQAKRIWDKENPK